MICFQKKAVMLKAIWLKVLQVVKNAHIKQTLTVATEAFTSLSTVHYTTSSR